MNEPAKKSMSELLGSDELENEFAPPGKLGAGIHRITMAQYLALPYLSSGLCNTLLQSSPHHAKHEQDHREDDANEASDTGTAIHDWLLEGVDRIVVCPFDDWRKGAAREMRDQARAEGKIPLLEDKVEQVQAAVLAAKLFMLDSELGNVFENGEPEQTIIWNEDGVLCKARPDWLTSGRDTMLHVKTTKGSAQPDSWIRNQLLPCGYDVAAAFYERALLTVSPEGGHTIVFLVVEQQPPYGCSLIGLSPAMWDIASAKASRAIRAWSRCQSTGTWPGYDARIHYAEPPAWLMAQEEEQRLTQRYIDDQGVIQA